MSRKRVNEAKRKGIKCRRNWKKRTRQIDFKQVNMPKNAISVYNQKYLFYVCCAVLLMCLSITKKNYEMKPDPYKNITNKFISPKFT